MSTIIIAAILIAAIVFVSFILVSIHNKQRQKKIAELLNHFSKLGTENNLSFSSHENLENCIIGLDGIKRKLLILKKIDEHGYDSLLFNLNEVKTCSAKKIYRTVNTGTEKNKSFQNQVEKIVLVFDFIDYREPVHVMFFEIITNNLLTMPELEQKAKNWETILTKLVNTNVKKIA